MKFNPLKGAIIALVIVASTLFLIVLYEKFFIDIHLDSIVDKNMTNLKSNSYNDLNTDKNLSDKNISIVLPNIVKKKTGSVNLSDLNKTLFDKNMTSSLKSVSISDESLSEIKDFKLSKNINVSKRSKEIKTNISCIQKVKHKKKLSKRASKRVKLAIIMDDVSFYDQIKEIKSLPFVVTPAIFPPTHHHPDTVEIAQRTEHYMVHLPMEAFHYFRSEDNTLLVSDSKDEILRKVSNIVEKFPHLIAVNNHTGSKFTANAEAMDKLFCALGTYGVSFIDSRTTAHTQAKRVGKLYSQDVLERNIFLDNKPDISYIRSQLKLAVKYAKEHGRCIAICHPRDETFKALKMSKNILKDVKVVYIDELLK